jgi:hypothetical protein
MPVLKLHHCLLHNLVEQVLVLPWGQVETLPEQGHLLMLDAEPKKGPVRDLGDLNNFLGFYGLAAAKLDELLPQSLELRMFGLEAPQIRSGIRADGDRLDDLQRVRQRERGVEIGR